MNNNRFSRELSRKTVALSRTSGFLSLAGSSIILYIIFSDRRNKLQQIHHRLLVGICCTDILFSIACIIATAAIPKDTPEIYQLYGNIGTAATCKAQGFFIQWGILGLPFYMASLSIYYVLVIRYKMKDEDISRRIEPIMHAVSTIIPFGFAVTGLCLNIYHSKLGLCWIEAKPWGCTIYKEIKCEVAGNAPIYEVWIAGVWILAVFIFQIVAMCLIYITVRRQERRMDAFAFRSSRNGSVLSSSSIRVSTKRKDTAIQACLYIFGSLLTFVWPFGSFIMARFGQPLPRRPYYLMIFLFLPLLGFWNFLAYIRSRYLRIRGRNRDKPLFWIFKATILVPTLDSGQRRDSILGHPSPARTTIIRTRNITQERRAILPRSFPMAGTETKKSLPFTSDLPEVSDDSSTLSNVIVPDSRQSSTSNHLSTDPSSVVSFDPIPSHAFESNK